MKGSFMQRHKVYRWASVFCCNHDISIFISIKMSVWTSPILPSFFRSYKCISFLKEFPKWFHNIICGYAVFFVKKRSWQLRREPFSQPKFTQFCTSSHVYVSSSLGWVPEVGRSITSPDLLLSVHPRADIDLCIVCADLSVCLLGCVV